MPYLVASYRGLFVLLVMLHSTLWAQGKHITVLEEAPMPTAASAMGLNRRNMCKRTACQQDGICFSDRGAPSGCTHYSAG
jgi:hypothetical protein